MSGAASRDGANGSEPLKTGSDIYLNDVISTDKGGFVIVTIGNASELTIGPETRMTIDSFILEQGHDLEAVSGAMGFEKEVNGATVNDTIRTVFGMIGVRG